MTSKRPPICCPEHGLPLDQLVAWGGGRYAWLCAKCSKWWPVKDLELDRLLDRVFCETLDEIFGKETKPVAPMGDREFSDWLERISVR